MRRAAISVAANIAEGFRKRGNKDKIKFYNMSQGSLDELEYYVLLSHDLKYYQNKGAILTTIKEIGKMLGALINSIRKRM